jgi:hypothetical protein
VSRRRPVSNRPLGLTPFSQQRRRNAGKEFAVNASTTTEKVAGSNLTAIAEYTDTARGLAELRQKHQGVVYDVTIPKQMKAAKEARAELRTLRTTLEKTRKEIKAPALERCRMIDEEARRITGEIVALEEPIDVQIKAEEARAEEDRLAKLEVERVRVEAIQQKIQVLRDVAASLVGKPSVIIQGRLERLRGEAPTEEEFAEHFLAAQDAHTAAIARVEQHLQAQLDHEAEQKRIQEERAELERVRAENERLQREAEERRRQDEEKAAAERAEQDRIAREAREREAQAQREREEAERAERQRQEDEARAQREEQERIEREERERQRAAEEAELRAERDRQAAEQKRLDEEAQRLQRERHEAARKAEADRLASLTLRTAAQAVVCYFQSADFKLTGGIVPQCVVDLDTALANDAAPARPARGKKAANA